MNPGDNVVWLQSTRGCRGGILGYAVAHRGVVVKTGAVKIKLRLPDQGDRVAWVPRKSVREES